MNKVIKKTKQMTNILVVLYDQVDGCSDISDMYTQVVFFYQANPNSANFSGK